MPSGYGDHRRQKIQDETYYQYPNGKSCYPFHIVLQNDCEFTGFGADGLNVREAATRLKVSKTALYAALQAAQATRT
jgi:hypothetical protein